MPSLGGGGRYGGSDQSGGSQTGSDRSSGRNGRDRDRDRTTRVLQQIQQPTTVGLAPGVTREFLQNQDNPLSRFAKQYDSAFGGMNTATEAMEGADPSFGSYIEDFFGSDNPGGFLASRGGSTLGFGLSMLNPLAGLAFKAAQASQGAGPLASLPSFGETAKTWYSPSAGQEMAGIQPATREPFRRTGGSDRNVPRQQFVGEGQTEDVDLLLALLQLYGVGGGMTGTTQDG